MMVLKSKLPLLLFFLFLSVTTLALAYESEQDPQREYQQCQQRCQQQEQHQQQQCKQRCEQQRREQQEKQRDPQQQYQQCQQRCQQEEQQQQQQCKQRCEQQRREQQERQRDPQQQYQQCQQRCQQKEQQQQQQCQQRCEQQRQKREQEEGQKGQGENTRSDPQQEYQRCQRRCQQQEQGSQGQQQQQCQQRCEERLQEQEEQQQRDPQQQFEQCKQRCQQQEQDQKQQCQQRCEEERQRQEQQQQGGNPREQQQEQERNNPYFLDEESFEERFRTQHGYVRVSQRFSLLSNLLRGIENYRLTLFEANPSTFMIPHHFDADAVFFVVRGRGTINLVQQEKRESYNLERGDVIRVPAGAMIYLINRDNNDKFQIASLFKPVSTPTNRFRDFFGVGGENPESFYNTFSDEILEAAFNTPREKLDKLFRQQRKGEIVEASQEQIRALTRDASSSQEDSPRLSKRGSQSRRPYNLLNQRPTHSNEYGQLYRVDANEYSQLQDLDVEVVFYNINKGAMVAPFYNSRATSLVVVVEGRGRFEMACPHLSSSQSQSQGWQGREDEHQEQEEGGSAHYQRVRARLSPRTAFIVPAGHPVSIVASDNQNLQIVAFKINAENNERNYLAGGNNLLNQLEREAKELSFNMPAREVESILNNQRQSVFLPGPNQGQQREEGRFLPESILDVMAF